jgi:membrane-bound lytic murein transglycosylase F
MRRYLLSAGLALLLLSLACVSQEDGTQDDLGFVETGDLPLIARSGVLRVLVPVDADPGRASRGSHPLDSEMNLIRAYAEQKGLEPHWIYVESRSELFPSLLEGRGDIVAANLTVTSERRESVDFTVPLRFVREQLVTRAGDASIERVEDLAGRSVSVRRSSSFWATMEQLQQKHPGILVEEALESLDTEELVRRVARRQIDLTVADNILVDAILRERDDIRAALDLTEQRPVAWAVRPDSVELLRDLNLFLTETQIAERRNEQHLGDLNEIRERKVLRVLTLNSASTYYLWRGELLGFEYELTREFARKLGLRVEIVVPPRRDDLLPWLAQGRGDVVAAGLTPTETHKGITYSRPYNYASRMVVTQTADDGLSDLDGLQGRSVFVRPSSSHWSVLDHLRRNGVPFGLHAAPEDLEDEEIIATVAEGAFDLTVAYSHILDIEMHWRDDIRGAFAVGDPVPLSWAVRESNPELKQEIDGFLKRSYRGLFYNVVYERYFKDPKQSRKHVEQRIEANGVLSPYDEIVKRHAQTHNFDWRLIVAMMYQESHFDPDARSYAGAVGLLQVLPRTGRQMGFNDVKPAESNIAAGVKYLSWLRDRFPEDLPVADRMWFALASFNAGHEHVRDARRLAEQQGWDANRWFGSVERAMLLLSRTQYAREARHGYCRGSEPVNYVREISARYGAYREALNGESGPVANSRRTRKYAGTPDPTISKPYSDSSGVDKALAQATPSEASK